MAHDEALRLLWEEVEKGNRRYQELQADIRKRETRNRNYWRNLSLVDDSPEALDEIGRAGSPPRRLPLLNELGMRIIGERVPHEDDLPVPSLEPGYVLLPWDVGVPDGPSPWRRLLSWFRTRLR